MIDLTLVSEAQSMKSVFRQLEEQRRPLSHKASISIVLFTMLMLLTCPAGTVISQKKLMKEETPFVVSKDDSFLRLPDDTQNTIIKGVKKLIYEKLADLETKSIKIMVKIATPSENMNDEDSITCEAMITFLYRMRYTAHLSYIRFSYHKGKMDNVKVCHDYKSK